jgi:hypothetical protein
VGSSPSLKRPATRGEIKLQHTATSLLAPERVRFRYKLDGHNVHWVEARDRREEAACSTMTSLPIELTDGTGLELMRELSISSLPGIALWSAE